VRVRRICSCNKGRHIVVLPEAYFASTLKSGEDNSMLTENSSKVSRRNGRDEGGNVRECRVESRDWGVPKIITVGDRLYQVEGCVTGADHGYSARGEGCGIDF
jgi:hypothetical protein